jgi:hypothetical protein
MPRFSSSYQPKNHKNRAQTRRHPAKHPPTAKMTRAPIKKKSRARH